MARGEFAARLNEPHALASGQYRAVADNLDPRLFQRRDISSLQTCDLLVLVGDQRRPVKMGIDMPAKALGDVELIGKAAGVNKKLLGHAAADHAGAADPVF